ncbi:hypothetical protein PU629_09000 [Pullulanibacillus sp. KACC 23026]|uniref:hypothetical protein n=1 Tax=Pullulanibacillus sp. KACC 23026 TaxID=3028315 RepID=UPI0023B0A939|nr:hypothetical protein [Pullulanibacillus sp. KACC 23026]WEG14473.1 hypothetical protein PU629_09000 [Pullulanibacillus sp. KACC 23026]
MEKISYPKVWNLDKVFMGGSKSSQFSDHIKRLEALVYELEDSVKAMITPLSTNEIIKVGSFSRKHRKHSLVLIAS